MTGLPPLTLHMSRLFHSKSWQHRSLPEFYISEKVETMSEQVKAVLLNCKHNQTGFCKFGLKCHRDHNNELCPKNAEEDIQNHVNTLKRITLVNIIKIVHILIQRTRI